MQNGYFRSKSDLNFSKLFGRRVRFFGKKYTRFCVDTCRSRIFTTIIFVPIIFENITKKNFAVRLDFRPKKSRSGQCHFWWKWFLFESFHRGQLKMYIMILTNEPRLFSECFGWFSSIKNVLFRWRKTDSKCKSDSYSKGSTSQ